MGEDTSTGNQETSYKNNPSKIDVKKTELEKVPQSLLDFNANFRNTKGLNFVKLSKETAMNDEKVLNEYNDVAVKGLKNILLVI